MSARTFFWNGVDGETGRPLFPPTTSRELAALALGEPIDPGELNDLIKWRENLENLKELRRLRHGDPCDLAQAGWGVIFAADDPKAPAARKGLRKLLAHRRSRAAATHETYYQEYFGERGYRRGETKFRFLTRHEVPPAGAADPERMPYYLLLVGDPEVIPFSFQYQLDVQYAVGRICFDTEDEYERYAQSVIDAETAPSRPRRAVLFAPQHPDDASTHLSSQDLAAPLAKSLKASRPGWTVDTAIGAGATKERLRALLNGEEDAAFVFTAGHGLGYPRGHRFQRARQGSLICQDFPGFAHSNGGVSPRCFFSAEDVGDAARVQGLVTFHFACYSGGTPKLGDFPPSPSQAAEPVAVRAFVSRLAQRLVGHPGGGALAVIGHVEKAWQLSIEWPRVGRSEDAVGGLRSIQAFEDAVDGLLAGKPVGYAMEPFGERYAELAADLAEEESEVARYRAAVDDMVFSRLLTGRNDSRNYIVVGDPAVRLAVPREPAETDEEDDEEDVLRGAIVPAPSDPCRPTNAGST